MTDYNHKPKPPPIAAAHSDAADALALKKNIAKCLSLANTSLSLGQVILLDELTSTQDQLKELLPSLGGGVHVLSADRQTQGRAQHQRRWQSAHGDLTFSAALPIRSDQIEHLPKLPLLVALGLCEALNQLPNLSEQVWLKWPNDLVIRSSNSSAPYAKLGGILCEFMPTDSYVVIGVGINAPPITSDHMPVQHTERVSLAQIGGSTDLGLLRQLAILALIGAVDQIDRNCLTSRYNPRHLLSGHLVELTDPHTNQHVIRGRCLGVDAQGAVLIQPLDSELTQRFFYGQLRLQR